MEARSYSPEGVRQILTTSTLYNGDNGIEAASIVRRYLELQPGQTGLEATIRGKQIVDRRRTEERIRIRLVLRCPVLSEKDPPVLAGYDSDHGDEKGRSIFVIEPSMESRLEPQSVEEIVQGVREGIFLAGVDGAGISLTSAPSGHSTESMNTAAAPLRQATGVTR